MRDVIVIGGGPAGLSAAAALAARGLDAVVLERRALPVDKACGEGLLPGGVRALETLGATGHLDPDGWSRLRAIRWIQEDGRAAEARLPAPGGMGIRRLALSAALAARARAAGAEVREGAAVEGHRRDADGVTVALASGEELRGRVLVAADGLASAVREREGLSGPARSVRRFGLRRHFAIAPWTDAVEVHFSPGVEAYVTPAGPHRVGLAFLFEEGTAPGFDGAAGAVSRALHPASGGSLRLHPGGGRAARPGRLGADPPPAGPGRGRRRIRRRHHRRGGVARAGGGRPARRRSCRRRSPGARPGRRSCRGSGPSGSGTAATPPSRVWSSGWRVARSFDAPRWSGSHGLPASSTCWSPAPSGSRLRESSARAPVRG